MKIKSNLNRSISSLGSVSKHTILALLLIPCSGILIAKTRVLVEEFNLRGSTDIIITPAEMTELLWRDAKENPRFQIHFNPSELAPDSFLFTVRGSCNFMEAGEMEINWTIYRTGIDDSYEFTYLGSGLRDARKEISSSLDSLVVPYLTVKTAPDSASVILNGVYVGTSPVRLSNMPLGTYLFSARTLDGMVAADTFEVTFDSTVFFYVLEYENNDKYSYLRVLSPPECELYVDGVHLQLPHDRVYKLQPGQREIRLRSAQYGTRQLSLNLTAGDTTEVGFFNHKP